jgi:uroporphyrinogen decarboxylase
MPQHLTSIFLQACAGELPPRRPVWLMRQAGRILQPYRQLRERTGSILKLFKTPELATEVTLMPVSMLGVDAAILFADILTPVEPMGCQIDFAPGPVFAKPVQSPADIDALSTIDPQAQLPYVLETIRLVRRALPADIPLIGFAGAPFTLATYMVEGGGAKEFTRFRRLLHADPGAAHALLDKLTEVTISYLRAQIGAGAQAVQLFDTWIGALSPALFEQLALPYLQRIFAALEGLGVPRIYYANGAAQFLELLPKTGADVLGLDWRVELDQAHRVEGGQLPLQGNMDPCALFADPPAIAAEAGRILRQTQGMPHIFNLGHGVHPDTPCDHVKLLIDAVHSFSG